MSRLKLISIALACAVVSTPSHAFMEAMIQGLTSVTNNLIDSGESVTNNAIDAGADSLKTVSGNAGLMADRIGVMADRIGFMADRIVTTEGLMAGLAHKIIDSNQPQVPKQLAVSAPVPAYGAMPWSVSTVPAERADNRSAARPNPWGVAAEPTPRPAVAPAQPAYSGHPYSASNMLYGVQGVTYTATTPAAQGYHAGQLSILNLPHKDTQTAGGQFCKVAYGVPLKC